MHRGVSCSINPTITSRRNARFPLAVLSLATALEDRYATQIIDGNVDRAVHRDGAVRAVASGTHSTPSASP